MARKLDIFFGFSQITIDNQLPPEAQMFDNLFRQVVLADELGFGTAWVGGAHLSLAEQQRSSAKPTLPHFRGEVCLNTDIVQLAPVIFGMTQQIGVGSAIQSILTNGGPVFQAEALRTWATLQTHSSWAGRRLHFGFGTGRFDFVHQAAGLRPRSDAETVGWPVVKGLIFREAAEIFVRLLAGQGLASSDMKTRYLTRAGCRSDRQWEQILDAHGSAVDRIEVAPFWSFDHLRLIPAEACLDTLHLYAGTTDKYVFDLVNTTLPCRVFNLSNTPPGVLDETHAYMSNHYHRDGGPWNRSYMPRTVLVFVDANPSRTPEAQREVALVRATGAIEAWQRAMAGTVDREKLQQGVDNAVWGNPNDVATKLHERFDIDDTLMLWFDFNDHDTHRVEQSMAEFYEHVVPILRALENA